MVLDDDSFSKGHEFESRRRIFDGHLDIYSQTFISSKNCIVCLKRPKINKKGRGWPIKKYF